MVISIYEEIVSLDKATQQDMKDKLVQLNIHEMFEHALAIYPEVFKQIVIYTAHAYSYESKLLRIGADWQKNKNDIAVKVGLPEEYFGKVVNLEDKRLTECFGAFLNMYHDNMDFIHLINLKETYQEVIILSKTTQDDAGKSDISARIKMMQTAEELLESIETQENKIKSRYRILNNPLKDFEHAIADNRSNPLKLENNPLIS